MTVLVALVAVWVLSTGDDEPRHRYLLRLPDAGQLDRGDPVRVGDRRVGNVADLRLAGDRTALVEVELSAGQARLRRGTSAVVRTAAPGTGSRDHVALALGPNDAAPLAEGATLTAGPAPADAERLLADLDPAARRSLRALLRNGSSTLDGHEQAAGESLAALDPAVRSSQRLLAQVTRDQPALERFLGSSSQIVTALAAERGSLTDLVGNARAAATAVLSQEQAIDTTLARLPPTLRHGTTSFASLRSTLDELDPLVEAATPASKRLARALRRAQPLARSAAPLLARLQTLLRTPGAGNDLTDLLTAAPALADALAPALEHSGTAARDSRPIAAFLRPFTPDAIGGLSGLAAATAGYDANGHEARVQPLVSPRALAADPVLGPLARKLDAALGPAADGPEDAGSARCPGTASQIRPDRSNGFRDRDGKLDCDPKAQVPGP